MTFSVDDFLGEFEAPTVEVRICPRQDLRDRHRQLEHELAEEGSRSTSDSLAGGSKARELAEQIREVEGEIEAATRVFRFRALSRRRWRSLIAAHPPRKEHKADQLDHNPETFPVAALAACAVEPAMTEEQAERLIDTVPLGEFEKMWTAVCMVNLGVDDTPKSLLATAILRTNGASSTTAAQGASPGASS